VAASAWRLEGGEFIIEVGASSRDIRLRTSIELSDDPDLPPLVPDEDLLSTRG
jgi:beta-glucosidase